MKLLCLLIFLILFTGCPGGSSPVWAQGINAPEIPKKTRILFLVDMSGSMLAKWENSTRMTIAKTMLMKLVDSLQQYKNLELALRVYGHLYDRTSNNCQDTRLEVPFSENNETQIITRLKQITPKGNTPITYSLTQTAKDFPNDKNARNVIILITDGLESCGGDPCAASLALQQKRIFLRPFVIGIGSDSEFAKQFSCVGQYFDAADINAFRSILGEVVNLALSKTTVAVELTDDRNRAVETNVNLTFQNAVTQFTEYNYVHYLDGNGKPDVLNIDALMDYNLIVNTVPPVIVPRLAVKPGRHNLFSVKVPQGTLSLKQQGSNSHGQVQALIKPRGEKVTLATQLLNSEKKYLAGAYEVEILTLPRIVERNVVLKAGQVTTLSYPSPGILHILNELQGFGSLYTLDNTGGQQWLYNLPETNSKINLPLQPGRYRIVYRTKFAKGSKFTDVQDFNIKSSATTTLKLFSK